MAEGLIPYVYRAIKRSRSRRKYECITLGRVQTFPAYNYGEFPATSGHYYLGPPPEKMEAGLHEQPGPRRYRSMGGFSSARFYPKEDKGPGLSKDMVRFSSNRFLSCITGA
ncbi:PREDICTED: uncharacterized protein LOC104593665 [Nelumbo nucifera]|uniref:Uncharacterized protein LOC104593665 n=1 Tax=Nelumbo nucifera TaxID=4432 RepID=A0A1U7ZSV1_NELNU|nr:PREDICTED: uncharacterized protein LOC104593665 [Nelumbo nucifera]